MNARERVETALNHSEPDRVPLDLGASATTGMQVSVVYRFYKPREQWSWRSWGGIMNAQDVAAEKARIGRELEQMKAAAAKLEFERAGGIKARLERLAELDGPAYAHAAPAEAFRFLLIQPGTTRQAAVFLADRGHVRRARDLAYPLQEAQLTRTLAAMARHTRADRPLGP